MSQRKIKWKSVDKDPKKLSTEELRSIIAHNTDYINMVGSERYDQVGSSASYEERLYNQLNPYAEELERRELEQSRPLRPSKKVKLPHTLPNEYESKPRKEDYFRWLEGVR